MKTTIKFTKTIENAEALASKVGQRNEAGMSLGSDIQHEQRLVILAKARALLAWAKEESLSSFNELHKN